MTTPLFRGIMVSTVNQPREEKKMDWIEIIVNYGVPMICLAVVSWFCYDQLEKARQDRKEMEEKHKQEVDGMTKALENNTLVLNKLVDKLDGKVM